MSEASNLLNSLTDEQIALYSANPATEPHIVIGDDRKVAVPEELQLIAVEGDHNIETVTFDCPRYWDGHDLSNMIIYINYLCPDGYMDAYLADNVRVDETDETRMHFDWTITRNVTRARGLLTFLICAKATDDEGNEALHWNSLINKEMTVAEGMECVEQVESILPDLITQVLLLNQRTLRCATVYVGSGEMPEGYNIKIDPENAPSLYVRGEDGVIYPLPELVGPKGEDGKDGENGKDGEDGKSAYQYAQEGGYTGSEETFYEQLAAAGNMNTSGVLYTEQTLSEEQKTQARTNIGASSPDDIPKDAVLYTEQTLSEEQKTQARTNIGASSPDDIPKDAVLYTEQTLSEEQKTQARTNIGVPTKVSQLENDEEYLTEHQDISGKLDKSGGTMTGTLVAQNNADYTTGQVRNIFHIAEGATLPSGASGDICLVYTP